MINNHWTAYWKAGARTSLPMDFKANYDGELAEYWHHVLKQQNGKPLSVLDVCTGNGAIAILLCEFAEKENIDIDVTAIDASDISASIIENLYPDKAEIINSIRFVGNTYVENMNQEFNQNFDLIVSQYGIEYCDTELAAESVSQLLNKNGRLIFVAHNPDTAMFDYMTKEESTYAYLDSIQLFKTFDRFANNKLSVNGFKNKLQMAMDDMRNQLELRPMELFKTWASTAMRLSKMNNITLKAQRMAVKNFNLKYEHARARAQDMLNVTDKLINQKEWYLIFEKNGLKLVKHDEIIYQHTHNVGHFYEFVKV